jgi:acyl-ACP thioesterase
MQEAARNHAHKLGWGVQLLKSKQQFWVLSRMIISIDEYPTTGTSIEIETWPKDKEKIFALRDFLVRQDEKIIARGTSSWALLQLPSRRPASLDGFGDIMTARKDMHAITETPQKLPSVEKPDGTFTHQVVFSELDQNGHVNNGRYINWLMDTFLTDFHRANRVQTMQLNYLAEVFPDQLLHIARKNISPHIYLFEVTDAQKKALFRGQLSFRALEH